jgi:uncharacterized protein YecE (DUF72 family)
MAIHIGTSGWAYASWKPNFYPPKLASRRFLEYYATQLNSVEVNYTFRQLPSEAMLNGWLAAAGKDFTFSFKAPQRITHFSRLKNCAEAVAAFYSALTPAIRANQLGVVLFQLPPDFKASAELLREFLRDATTSEVKVAFEFRHDSWFQNEIFDVLAKYRAALCAAESDDLRTPDVVTAPFRCYRLRKSDYSPEELNQIIATMKAGSKNTQVFAYFKHEEAPTGALNASAVLKRLREG